VRPVVLSGLTLATAGLALLAATTEVGGDYLGVLGGLLAMAIGMGATFVPMTLVATTNVEPDDAGLASGIFNTSQQVGGALGLAILSTLAASRTADLLAGGTSRPEALVEGFQLAFIVAAAMLAVGAVLTAALLRRKDVERIESGDAVPVPA
jgi:MFS family permease